MRSFYDSFANPLCALKVPFLPRPLELTSSFAVTIKKKRCGVWEGRDEGGAEAEGKEAIK